MRITDLRLRQLTGTLDHAEEFWEERLQRPIDVYPEHKAQPAAACYWIPQKLNDGRYRVHSLFL